MLISPRPAVEEFKRLCADEASVWGMADSDVVELCDYILMLEERLAELQRKVSVLETSIVGGACE